MDNFKVKRDSKSVKGGDVFYDLSDNYQKGYQYAKEALERGAVKVVTERNYPLDKLEIVKDVRKEFGEACAKEYGYPAKDLRIIGITGTNGKTTCTHILYEILKGLNHKVARVGTLGVHYDDVDKDYDMTTPDADILQREFYEMKKRGIEFVVMEVSAHAISQKRIEEILFEVGVLTNITQDHLDYFGTMEKYAECKLSFFDKKYVKSAVVNIDDKYALPLFKDSKVPTIYYGVKNPADVFAVNVNCGANGSEFFCNIFDDVYDIKTKLVGEYNVMNVLACLSVCANLGLDMQKVCEKLKTINPVEGRFNVINIGGKNMIIDFAHTPDGLEKVLMTARKLSPKRLYCIFGCGGNRDVDKRHKMGAIAEKYADYVCLTNDNPRLEDENLIIKDIEKGMEKPHMVETDRAKAIEKVFKFMQSGDVVVIAGKGAEKYQIIGTQKVDYSDFDVVYSLLKNEKTKEEYGN